MEEYSRFIGTKIIKAKPMTANDFRREAGEVFEDCEDQNGYKVIYEDGYNSWSPKSTFERAYREITKEEINLLN